MKKWIKVRYDFLRLIWKIINNKVKGYVFFHITEEDQQSYIEGKGTGNISVKHLGVNEDFIQKFREKVFEVQKPNEK